MAFEHARLRSADDGSLPAGEPRGGSVCPPEQRGHRGETRDHINTASVADQRPTATGTIVRLKRRTEFLAVAATGRRWIAHGFVLQIGPRPCPDGIDQPNQIGIGFTATKRIGNAVARNRAKRRLREAARLLAPSRAAAGHDYVLIARAGVLTCAFQTLLTDLERAFSRVHGVKPRLDAPRRPRRRPRQADPPSSQRG